jgi:hypothetical protein
MHFFNLLRRWGPAVLIMAAIAIFSAQPKVALPDYGGWDLVVKKGGHLAGYAVLAVAYLWALTFRPEVGGLSGTARGPVLLGALVLAALYGASDELHQAFVPGRGASVIDVGIDALGASVGLALAAAWQRRRPTQTPARPAPPRSTR